VAAVTSIAVTNTGSSYEDVPTVSIDVPFRTIPTSGVTIATEQFTYATHGLAAADPVKYYRAGGTAITGLSDATEYFVSALGLLQIHSVLQLLLQLQLVVLLLLVLLSLVLVVNLLVLLLL
jgi:hypothetical protein